MCHTPIEGHEIFSQNMTLAKQYVLQNGLLTHPLQCLMNAYSIVVPNLVGSKCSFLESLSNWFSSIRILAKICKENRISNL
jgi:hypothetical protein